MFTMKLLFMYQIINENLYKKTNKFQINLLMFELRKDFSFV